MTREFDITGDDARRAYRFKQRSLLCRVRRGRLARLVGVLWWVALTGMFFMLGRILESAPPSRTAIFYGWAGAVIVLAVAYRIVLIRQAMNIWLCKDTCLVGQHILSFDVDGVRETTPNTEAWWKWDVVTGIEDANPGIFIGNGSAFFLIPRRSFATPEEAEAFVAELRRLAPAVEVTTDPLRRTAS